MVCQGHDRKRAFGCVLGPEPDQTATYKCTETTDRGYDEEAASTAFLHDERGEAAPMVERSRAGDHWQSQDAGESHYRVD